MRDRMVTKEQSGSSHTGYIPALRFHWLTPVYDLLLRWAFPEQRLKRHIVNHVGAPSTLLDLGCGTGTLTGMLQSARPQARIAALDIDSAVLDIARRKATEAGVVGISFVQGSASMLPFDDATFDCIASSLVIHHLTLENKQWALRECQRVMRPGGMLLIADFAAPRSAYAWAVSALVRHLEEVEDNVRGRLPGLIADAGFTGIEALAHFGSILGTLTVYRAFRP